MKAIRIIRPGEPEVLELAELDDPVPGPGQIRVEVHGTALNRADLLQRRGAYPAPPGAPPDIPGLEFSGVVEAVGPGGDESAVGSWVMGLVGGGGYAELLVTEASHVVPMPLGLQFVECAAVPEAFCTAYDALVLQGGLRSGQTVLIHAAGSGVGTAAIQIARAFGAAKVFGTASAAKLEALEERGLSLDVSVDYRKKSFRDVIRRETEGKGVDLILDLVGASYWTDNIASLCTGGRIVLVGLVGGTMAQLNLGVLLRRRLHVIGTVMRSRTAGEKNELAASTRQHLLPRFESGELFPVVDRVYDLTEAAAAHTYMEENRNAGKVVLRVRN